MHKEMTIEQEKLYKLRKMRIIATSLLGLMAVFYLIFKRFETQNIFFSSIVAFSEAAMIGALADWFAVVALFRHPAGMKWIPHTAIIPNNKDRIGESISNFVVSNFFTEEVIGSRLEGIDLTLEIGEYLKKNRDVISEGMIKGLPDVLQTISANEELMRLMGNEVKKGFEKVKLYPLLGSGLEVLVSSGQHIPLTKELLVYLYNYISENKERTLRFVESLNKTLSLPFIGDIVYRNILKTLSRQIDDMENNADTEARRLLLYSLPQLAQRLKTSEELIEKGEAFKNDIVQSELFDNFIFKILQDMKEFLISYSAKPEGELKEKLDGFIDKIIDGATSDHEIKEKINSFIKKSIISVICAYKEEISKLIRHTVEEWDAEDMVMKIEMHVGADLQYIRINGTVIGGLAGLVIHLLGYLF
ncbi:MAG: DUF445 domain-containing protein [Clostridia bacterium]|nr:DUF445 domain-containing protein [Clostridia bacterium]